ncbi:uncharacterized protein ACN2A1_007277 [Glossina fuscipes fuscipes]
MSTFHEMLLSAINLIGLLVTVCFLYDNFKSLFSILKAVLEPYFRPQLPHTLPEKFGKWAELDSKTGTLNHRTAIKTTNKGHQHQGNPRYTLLTLNSSPQRLKR